MTAKILRREEGADLTAVHRFLRACAWIGLVESADEVNFTGTPLFDYYATVPDEAEAFTEGCSA